MNRSEICDCAAKALCDIQDATNLIILDMLEGRDPAGASTRFAAIRQYASMAQNCLSALQESGGIELPNDRLQELLARRSPNDSEALHAAGYVAGGAAQPSRQPSRARA